MNNIYNNEVLKQQYMEIDIPQALDEAIIEGLNRGKRKAGFRQMRQRALSAVAVLLIALSALTVSVNVSPAFANALSDIPVIGRIVQVLRFVDGTASGGSITDGLDINQMEVVSTQETERFVIHFSQDTLAQDGTGAYKVQAYENPHIYQFDIGGARMISAREDFETIRGLERVKDVYTLMTLDDSLIRFQVLLDTAVDVEIAQISNPNGLMVTLSSAKSDSGEEDNSSEKVYTVRSKSYPYSESFGHLEEALMWQQRESVISTYRIMKDQAGSFLFELGQFESEASAQDFIDQVKDQVSIDLYIEARSVSDLPKAQIDQ
jgi:hypothetical protein